MQDTQQNSCIQPSKLANKNGEIRFQWPVSAFDRLVGLLYSNVGEVNVLINACYDHNKRCLLNTKITAKLLLECQTTFESIAYVVEREVVFCTVTADTQFDEIDDNYEPVLIDDGMLQVKPMIEDELILSLPIVANKSIEEIGQKMSFGKLDEEAIIKEAEVKNPFSVLVNLKKT